MLLRMACLLGSVHLACRPCRDCRSCGRLPRSWRRRRSIHEQVFIRRDSLGRDLHGRREWSHSLSQHPHKNDQSSPKSIAFHLPQFHPIPENDQWWGAGFTEWRNVVKGRPRFRGHYQPHLPADLGFYDLRLPETRALQAELARDFGIDGFCYYHYWFNGRRLLERPVEEILRLGEPNFPFMLCWANENWTRRWDGDEHEILIEQRYSEEDDVAHLRHLAPYFADQRYIRLDGKPVFLVYAASRLPDARRTTDTWRAEAHRLGLGELFLCRVESHKWDRGDPRPLGFDAAVEFAPDFTEVPKELGSDPLQRALRKLIHSRSGYRHNHVYDYAELIKNMLAKPRVDYPRFRGVSPSWDNSARRRKWAVIFRGSTPELFGGWLEAVLEDLRTGEGPSGLIFVNAWNEWAEGNHLEPDERFGLRYLEAHRRAMQGARPRADG